MKKADPNRQSPETSPERANFPPILHAIASIVITHCVLVCVVAFANDRQLVHVDATSLKLLHRLIRFRMGTINCDD